jgi:phosphomannomutase
VSVSIQMKGLDEAIAQKVKIWLEGDFDSATKHEIEKMIETNPKELIDAFYTNLSFGTGGLRGVMGPGTNRMNIYTVRFATQGLANYLKNWFKDIPIRVAIGYDSRHHSVEFAKEAARVLAGNGIDVFLFESLRPTPLVSFALRYKACQAAIMITASHNPPQYNGYKVYWDDGGQVLPPHDKGIIKEASRIEDLKQVKLAPENHAKIHMISKEVDDAYFEEILKYRLYPELDKKSGHELKILYSNLHGTGITIVPEALSRYGFTNVGYVDEQTVLDGSFPTTPSPNPEERQALELGIKKMLKEKYDIFLATDPDCDRIGVVVRVGDDVVLLTGNQMGAIAVDAIARTLSFDTLSRAGFVKTIVTTDLFRAIVERHGGHSFDVLPGFKYIAEKIRLWEKEQGGLHYIFGCEESYGCLLGTHVRDKDAAIACCLASEIALKLKKDGGKTLVDALDELYRSYGYFHEKLFSIKFEDSKAGKEAQQNIMKGLRAKPPEKLLGCAITKIGDLSKQQFRDLETKEEETIDLPKSDVLIFILQDSSKVIVRPSGTEPKMKVYLLLKEVLGSSSLEEVKERVQKRALLLEEELKKIFK